MKTCVLCVTTTFPRSDDDRQPRFVLDLNLALKDSYNIYVLAPSSPERTHGYEEDGIVVHRFRYFLNIFEKLTYGSGILSNLKKSPMLWFVVPFFLIGMAYGIWKSLKVLRPDVIHAHWWFPTGFLVVLLNKLTGLNARVIITCHGADYFVIGRRLRKLLKWVISHSDKVAMVSKSMIDDAQKEGFDVCKLCHAPMGADLSSLFIPTPRVEKKGILFVGRFVEKKGVDTLIQAWSLLNDEIRSEGLTVIGDGLMKEKLINLVVDLGLEKSVRFVPFASHSELSRYYRVSKLLVFPSKISEMDNDQEGLGLVPIEAMGCGSVVLSSNIKTLEYLIRDGETGFTFPMGDERVLAEKIQYCLQQDQKVLNRISESAREAALSLYDWSVIGEKYSKLYSG